MREKFKKLKSIGTVKYYGGKAKDPEFCEMVISFLKDEDPHVARNAAWVMTHFSQKLRKELRSRQNEFIDIIMSTDDNPGLRRLLLNVVEFQGIAEQDLRTDFLDFCLEHMCMPEEAPGIQALCMKLSFEQCKYFPELMHEFKEILLIMQNGYAISMTGLRKKMLARIEKFEKPKVKKKASAKKRKTQSRKRGNDTAEPCTVESDFERYRKAQVRQMEEDLDDRCYPEMPEGQFIRSK